MKKFYATILSVALATLLPVSAKNVGGIELDLDNPIPASARVTQHKAFRGHTMYKTVTDRVSTVADPMSRAEETWASIGVGTFYDYVFTGESYEVEIEESQSRPGVYRIPEAWKGATTEPVPFIIDASDPEFVLIEEQRTGVYFEQFGSEAVIFSDTWDAMMAGYTKDAFIAEFPEAVITLEDKVIMIPAGGLLMMFPDSTMDYEGKPIKDMIFYANDGDMPIVLPGGEYTEPWVYWGEGVIKDGFIHPIFGYEGEENNPPYEIDIYKGNIPENEGVIYCNAWYVWEMNDPLFFIISDPNIVQIPLQYFDKVPVTESVESDMYFLSFAYNNGVGEPDGMPAEDFLKKYAKENIAIVDGVIEMPENCVLFYLPQYDQENLYTMKSEEGYLVLPETETGISDVAVDANTTVYYNMQGMSVANPTPGNLYIVKTGNKVVKRIIR